MEINDLGAMTNLRIGFDNFFCQNMDCKLHIPCYPDQKGLSIPTSKGYLEYDRVKIMPVLYDCHFYVCDDCAAKLDPRYYTVANEKEDEMIWTRNGYTIYEWYAIDASDEKKRPKIVNSGMVVARDPADANRQIGRETDEDHEIVIRQFD